MICLFCHSKCLISKYDMITSYRCDFCLVDDMSKYIVTYANYPTTIMARTMIIDNFHIIIDYEKNNTIISKLIHCFIMDRITLPRALVMDVKNPHNIMDKIKTLLVFS